MKRPAWEAGDWIVLVVFGCIFGSLLVLCLGAAIAMVVGS